LKNVFGTTYLPLSRYRQSVVFVSCEEERV
ncbi:hypothetical protein RCH05_004585, partial [Janthinobacterium sp. CAN_S7]